MRSLLVLLGALLAPQASAWWCNGHMYTAAIAYRNLTGPVKDKVDSLVAYFSKEYTTSPDFIQAVRSTDPGPRGSTLRDRLSATRHAGRTT